MLSEKAHTGKYIRRRLPNILERERDFYIQYAEREEDRIPPKYIMRCKEETFERVQRC